MPVITGFRLSIELNKMTGSAVSGLVSVRSPAAILGAVRPVVVDTFERMVMCRTFSHVGQKSLRGVSPSVAHRNAPASISGIASTVGVETSGFQPCPSGVSRVSMATGVVTMLVVHDRGFVGLVPPATVRHASGQGALIDFAKNTAFALATPIRLTVPFRGCSSQYKPSSKLQPREISASSLR